MGRGTPLDAATEHRRFDGEPLALCGWLLDRAETLARAHRAIDTPEVRLGREREDVLALARTARALLAANELRWPRLDALQQWFEDALLRPSPPTLAAVQQELRDVLESTLPLPPVQRRVSPAGTLRPAGHGTWIAPLVAAFAVAAAAWLLPSFERRAQDAVVADAAPRTRPDPSIPPTESVRPPAGDRRGPVAPPAATVPAATLPVATVPVRTAVRSASPAVAPAPDPVERSLARVERAIGAWDVELARRELQTAAALAPSHPGVRRALQRLRRLEGVLPLLRDARAAELRGDYARAMQGYAQVAAVDRDNRRAREAVARMRRLFGDAAHERALAEGYGALGRGDLEAARAAFERALASEREVPLARRGLEQVQAAIAARGTRLALR